MNFIFHNRFPFKEIKFSTNTTSIQISLLKQVHTLTNRKWYFKIHAKYNKLPLEKLNRISIGYQWSSIFLTGKAKSIEI
jgi:hypothetical protein